MRTLVALTAMSLSVWTGACDQKSPLEPEDIPGTYILERAFGEDLPAPGPWLGTSRLVYLAGFLTLNPDNTFRGEMTLRQEFVGGLSTPSFNDTLAGPWELGGAERLTVSDTTEGGLHYDGQLRGRKLSLWLGVKPVMYTFIR
jgi:hypothetical protein